MSAFPAAPGQVSKHEVSASVREALATSRRRCSELLPEAEWLAKLVRSEVTNTPLRIKLGLDPTAPDIHLGHTVVLNKLRELQDLGHTVIFLIGDFTSMIGDPSGRNTTRPPLTRAQIEANAQTYYAQASLVLDPARTEIRYNSEWSDPLGARGIIELAARYTVARMMERDDFSKRYAANDPITLTELLYPLMQAYDSVAIQADVELGGTDQLYNLLMGRQVMEYYGMIPQCVVTTPLLVGTDGKIKMSKSVGNYIGVTDPPGEMFGKVMSIPDHLMPDYYSLLLDRPMPEGEPVEQKRELARSLVSTFHGDSAVAGAEKLFDAVVRREVPEDAPVVRLPAREEIWIVDLITLAGFAKTNGEARRFVKGGAVRVGGRVVRDERLSLPSTELQGKVLQVGKRRYARLTL